MALIQCPECGRENVSDTATSCPNCGCPIERTIECPYCNFDTNKTYKEIQELGCSVICENCGKNVRVTSVVEKLAAKAQSNIPKYPICGSTNLSKITVTKKAMKIATFGIFGMGDNGKTWKCNSCGSKF